MDPVLIRAWLPLAPDVVEAGLSACVTSSAVFLPASWLVDGRETETGARVTVEVGSEATGIIARFAGVVGWRARGDVGAGDAGIGIFVGASVDDMSSALLARLARRPGAGARVLPPGASASRAARAVNAALVDDTVAEASASTMFQPAAMPSAPGPRLMGLLADQPAAVSDGEASALVPAAWAEREALLAAALAHVDDDDADATLTAGAFDGLDNVRTLSGAVERPFANLLLDVGSDVDAFPDAPPPAEDNPRPFEGQSTDVDLLREVSAADVIALNLVAERTRADTGGNGTSASDADSDSNDDSDDDDDLPSMEAELVADWEDDTPAGGQQTTVTTAWVPPPSRVPSPSPWPIEPEPQLLIVGASWSMSRRGQLGIEPLSWPAQGTRRMSGQGDIDTIASDDDADVFGPPPGPPNLGSAAGAERVSPPDPFAAQITDPRLNVEGLVARHVRASHNDVFAAADIDVDVDRPLPPAADSAFAAAEDRSVEDDDSSRDDDSDDDDDDGPREGDDPDATNDELRLPRLPPLLSETPASGIARSLVRPLPPPTSSFGLHDRSSDEGTPQ